MKNLVRKVYYKFYGLVLGNKGVSRVISDQEIIFPLSYSKYYPEDYEPDLFKFIDKYCADRSVFLDCGAHFGLFSVVASMKVGEMGKVISFEPMPEVRSVLEDVIRLNKCSNVTVRSEAVSRVKGTATFFDTGNEGSNANSLVQQERHHDALTVNTISIDDISKEIGKAISCIKVDVEGAEYDLLQGAEQVLFSDRPAIYLSLHPEAIGNAGASLEQIWDFLHSAKYNLQRDGVVAQKEWFVGQTDLFDVVCLPA